MPTLKSILEIASGLYQVIGRDTAFGRDELLERLPPSVLTSPASIERMGTGVYRIRVEHEGDAEYVLYSRRRFRRPQPTMS